MKDRRIRRGRRTRISFASLLFIGGACLSLAAVSAAAQFNRSRPPSPPAPSGGAPRGDSGRAPINSSPRFDRGRTPDVPSDGSGSVPDRNGRKNVDRFNRTQEGQAARVPRTGNIHPVPYYFPYGYPGGYFPGGYFPGGYFPGGYDPYGIPPYPYPYPEPYPVPRDRSPLAARYDSPYYYCTDLAGARYVNGLTVVIAKPKRLYTPTPVYKDGEIAGWRDLGADDYLADRNAEDPSYRVRELAAADPALDTAIADIGQSWTSGDVEPLARHVRKDAQIAIVLGGKYLYSLEAGDFLEVTRDAYESAPKLRFVVDHIHRRADGIYALTGRHLFTDNQGKERTVYFTYVLTRSQDDYIVTQVASAADRD